MLSRLAAFGLSMVAGTALHAQNVNITEDMAEARFEIAGQTVVISRDQDQRHEIEGEFALTSRSCPPFCIQPAIVAPGVETIAELELIDFLQGPVQNGTGLLIDSRVPEWFVKGTIPGAINVPFTTLDPDNGFRDQILEALGARKTASGMDFSDVLDLAMFCNGPWCAQAPRGIRSLLDAGYPPEKIHYYRGGMQDWLMMGLTVETPPA